MMSDRPGRRYGTVLVTQPAQLIIVIKKNAMMHHLPVAFLGTCANDRWSMIERVVAWELYDCKHATHVGYPSVLHAALMNLVAKAVFQRHS
jgi:hypothetical protein